MSASAALRPFEPAWRRALQGPGGRLAAAAALLLLAALALAAVLEPHWRAAAQALDARRAGAPIAAPAPPWPAADAHAARVSALLGLARRHGITVRALREDAAVPAAAEATAGVGWRGLTLSAEGRYAELRAFAASALAADAALALDSLVLQRTDTAQGLLRADFGFAFAHAVDAAAPGEARPTRGRR
jgi:hypothetical protein